MRSSLLNGSVCQLSQPKSTTDRRPAGSVLIALEISVQITPENPEGCFVLPRPSWADLSFNRAASHPDAFLPEQMPELAYAVKLESPKHAGSARSGRHRAEHERAPGRVRLPDGMLMAPSSQRFEPVPFQRTP